MKCLHSLASILFACKNVAFYTKQDFSRAWNFPHHTLFVFWTFFFSFWIDWLRIKAPRFRGLYLKSRQMRYLHPKISNEAGFWHRQPRLVTYATWISLLRSHQALQQLILRRGYLCINKSSVPLFSGRDEFETGPRISFMFCVLTSSLLRPTGLKQSILIFLKKSLDFVTISSSQTVETSEGNVLTSSLEN